MFYKNLLETIGNTPLIKIQRWHRTPQVNLFAKLEGQNPGGSIKDRVALYMLEKAEQSGTLTHEQTILEATSGNMGIALALVAAQKSYKVKIVMSAAMSEERKLILRSLGAELLLTDPRLGTKGAIQYARQLKNEHPKQYWFADQFNNPDNTEAHYMLTAPELLREIKKIDVLVVGIGTAGTLGGLAKRFRKDSPQTKIVGVIPPPGYKLQGIQNPDQDFKGQLYDKSLIDQQEEVSVKDAFKVVKELARSEGLFLGMSSGAVLFAAQKVARSLTTGNIVALLADRGEKYLSTNLFNQAE